MGVLNTADAVYVGADAVDAVYLGGELVWSDTPPVARTNLVFNPSIEGDTVGYSASQVNTLVDGGAILRVTSQQVDRTASLRITTVGTAQGVAYLLNGTYTVGVAYTFSVYLKGNAGGESMRVFFGDLDDGDWTLTNFAITASWARYSFTWTPANAVVLPGCTVRNQDASAVWFQDAHQVEVGSAATAYGDGASSGWAWNGTPDASTSTGS